MNPTAIEAAGYLQEIEKVARIVKQEVVVLKASTPDEIDAAFAELVRKQVGALIVSTDGYLFSRRDQLVALSVRHNIPTIYDRRAYAAAGGLISYGPDLANAYRLIGVYVGRILNGDKAADLPVVQPTRFELVINRKPQSRWGLHFQTSSWR